MRCRPGAPARRLGGTLLSLAVLAACGGGSLSDGAGGLTGTTERAETAGTGPPSVETAARPANRPPIISNLRAFTLETPCTLVGRTGSLLEGWQALVRFSYRDPDGNIPGGRIEETFRFDDHDPEFVTYSIPGRLVRMTGTSKVGTIDLGRFCVSFGGTGVLIEAVTLIDRGGLRSNTLTTIFPRPLGHPLLPQPRDPGAVRERRPS